VGYLRVSSLDQNTVRQLDGIDVERTFTDKASGKDTARPKLDEMLAFVRDGDTVIVHSMDRLARNLDDLRRIVRMLTGKGVRVEFVKAPSGDTPEDALLVQFQGMIAEYERYAELGIALVMPTGRLCRLGGEMPARTALAGRLSRHNHRLSRKASRVSDGL